MARSNAISDADIVERLARLTDLWSDISRPLKGRGQQVVDEHSRSEFEQIRPAIVRIMIEHMNRTYIDPRNIKDYLENQIAVIDADIERINDDSPMALAVSREINRIFADSSALGNGKDLEIITELANTRSKLLFLRQMIAMNEKPGRRRKLAREALIEDLSVCFSSHGLKVSETEDGLFHRISGRVVQYIEELDDEPNIRASVSHVIKAIRKQNHNLR